MLGTLRYASPEQALGKASVDERSDVYSLGASLYELATLTPIFPYGDRERLLQAVVHDAPVAPRRIVPQAPRDLETILLTAAAKDASERYQTARELAEDLRSFLDHKPIRARRASAADQFIKWTRRNSISVIAVLVTAAVALTTAFGLLWASSARRAPRSTWRNGICDRRQRSTGAPKKRRVAKASWLSGWAKSSIFPI